MATVRNREKASDNRFGPTVYYTYILRLADDSLYVGQTNDLASRVVEHAVDAGAEATKGQEPRLVWFSHTHDRAGAIQMEQRLQEALKRSPLEVEAIIERFDALLDLVRPQKTLRQLEEEERAYEAEMGSSFHYVSLAIGNRKAACGWDGGRIYGKGIFGTSDWKSLLQMEREMEALEAVGGKLSGKQPCRRCLALAPR